MTLPPSPNDPNELRSALRGVHRLGAVTEQLFTRLYHGLIRRSRLTQQDYDEVISRLQLSSEENERLREQLDTAADEAERFKIVFEALQEGIVLLDLQGRVRLMNHAARQVLDGSEGLSEADLLSLLEPHQAVQRLDSDLVPLGAPLHFQLGTRILSVQLAALADARHTRVGTLLVLRDITREAAAERLQRGFITHFTHELNTPMAVLKMSGDMLRSQPEDAPANRRMLELLGRNLDILSRMVDELADVAQMTQGTFSIHHETTSVEDVVWNVADRFAERIEQAGLTLSVMLRDAEQLFVSGDGEKLEWALEHLVRNSISYTEPGGFVEIIARPVKLQSENYVVLYVLDNGAGISQDDLPFIFDLFYRGRVVNSSGKRIDPRGLGQGLFIARHIIDAHAGSIQVSSEAGKGSVFTISLPAVPVSSLPQ